jgi:hypothetical protein
MAEEVGMLALIIVPHNLNPIIALKGMEYT